MLNSGSLLSLIRYSTCAFSLYLKNAYSEKQSANGFVKMCQRPSIGEMAFNACKFRSSELVATFDHPSFWF